MGNKTGLLVFESTNSALKTEKLLKRTGIPCTIIPTPVEISSECGIAVLVEEDRVEEVRDTLGSSGYRGYQLIYPFRRGERKGSDSPGRRDSG